MNLTIAFLDTVSLLPSQDISVASVNGPDEGEGLGRGFVDFFSWALFCFLIQASSFFVSSYKQVPFIFHQVIYMGNSTSDTISTEINCLK